MQGGLGRRVVRTAWCAGACSALCVQRVAPLAELQRPHAMERHCRVHMVRGRQRSRLLMPQSRGQPRSTSHCAVLALSHHLPCTDATWLPPVHTCTHAAGAALGPGHWGDARVLADHDNAVWLGDLNYRLNIQDDDARRAIRTNKWVVGLVPGCQAVLGEMPWGVGQVAVAVIVWTLQGGLGTGKGCCVPCSSFDGGSGQLGPPAALPSSAKGPFRP